MWYGKIKGQPSQDNLFRLHNFLLCFPVVFVQIRRVFCYSSSISFILFCKEHVCQVDYIPKSPRFFFRFACQEKAGGSNPSPATYGFMLCVDIFSNSQCISMQKYQCRELSFNSKAQYVASNEHSAQNRDNVHNFLRSMKPHQRSPKGQLWLRKHS